MEYLNEHEQFETIKMEVINKLNEHKIPYEYWGMGSAKTLDHLVKEVLKGESVLEENEKGELVRKLAVLWVNVFHKTSSGETYLLKEEKQMFKDGRERRRRLEGSIAEKLQASEQPDESSIARALKEELNINTTIFSEAKGEDIAKGDSASYPGLPMEMKKYHFDVEIADDEFKPEGYTENQADKDTYFVWEKVE